MEQYPNLNETSLWVQDLRRTHELGLLPRTNPFVEHTATFDSIAELVLEFGHRFGSFQNLECHTLKRKLVEMEEEGTGRVLLGSFYSNALAGGWEFMESVEYLRNQGALDETDIDNPTVVIPNYMNSRMNCLTASDFYGVCCLNECDELMGKIEAQIAAPYSDPASIAGVVSGLQSDTVDAPRNLSSVLLKRLDEVAYQHAGKVPLHGRLFAQWLHHAYPRECSFPHVQGAVKPMYPAEFAETMGADLLEVRQETMEEHVERLQIAARKQVELPWTSEEELFPEHERAGSLPLGVAAFKGLVALVALASFAVPLVRSLRAAVASPS